MAVLVTRPHPDNAATAAALRARNLEAVLAPMLRQEVVAFQLNGDAAYSGVLVTSANALRAVEQHPALPGLLACPLYAVGDHTADEARRLGFTTVFSAGADAIAMRQLLDDHMRDGRLVVAEPLLYLAGADLSRNLAAELRADGIEVVKVTVYKMAMVTDLPRAAADQFTAGECEAVLHYSRRSARAFTEAARAGGVEICALSVPQVCISEAVAAVVREAGALQVQVAATPDEIGVFAALDRALAPLSR